VKLVVYQGVDGFWYWHLKAENGEVVADSAERLPAQGLRDHHGADSQS
jgi:Domain of unknown function (DUF1508)